MTVAQRLSCSILAESTLTCAGSGSCDVSTRRFRVRTGSSSVGPHLPISGVKSVQAHM